MFGVCGTSAVGLQLGQEEEQDLRGPGSGSDRPRGTVGSLSPSGYGNLFLDWGRRPGSFMSKDVLLILKAGHCLSQDSASVPGVVDLTLISPSGMNLGD